MNPTDCLIEFVRTAESRDIDPEARQVVDTLIGTVLGTAVAGAAEEGIAELRAILRGQSASGAATSWVYGDRLPAPAAALLNAVMARALDYCDGMEPGLHLGTSIIPAALAAAEHRGGVSGDEFTTAVAVGAEFGARLNLKEAHFDGFDPTGVIAPLAATAAAARILGLPHDQMRGALGLAFNRAGGTFQNNIDGSLAVRLVQGWAAEAGVACALWAQRGLGGTPNFLDGVYGYTHLFGRDTVDASAFVEDLGKHWRLTRIMFKKYPSCGLTQGATELALQAWDDGIRVEQIDSIDVAVPPYAYRLVGHSFSLRSTPRVDGQFSIRYCVANALFHGSSKLDHFTPAAVTGSKVGEFAHRVRVHADPTLDARGHTAIDLTIVAAGTEHTYSLDIAPGFPGNALSSADHESRFDSCLDAAPFPLPPTQSASLRERIADLRRLGDVAVLVGDLVSAAAPR